MIAQPSTYRSALARTARPDDQVVMLANAVSGHAPNLATSADVGSHEQPSWAARRAQANRILY
jgi:hypothetical protein